MDGLLNIARNYVLVKDVSDIIDFDNVTKNIEKVKMSKNIKNSITETKNMCAQPEFEELGRVLKDQSVAFLRNFYMQDPAISFEDLQISESWANVSLKGEEHHIHEHPFSIVSGVLFLDDTPDNLNLTFETHPLQIPFWKESDKAYISLRNLTGSEDNLYRHLVLFISSVGHFVSPVEHDIPRRSIAFNTFWKGKVGKQFIEVPELDKDRTSIGFR
jgi:uncharacterized protein (TIGR02466 family)